MNPLWESAALAANAGKLKIGIESILIVEALSKKECSFEKKAIALKEAVDPYILLRDKKSKAAVFSFMQKMILNLLQKMLMSALKR